MCLVEVNTSVKLVASCAMPLMNNMQVSTSTDRVKKARESVLEFLLVNHPLDCPICDQGGECDLQDITLVFGSDSSRFYEYAKRAVFDKNVGTLVKMIMTRCIHCTRCVRFLNEVCGNSDLGMLGRGSASEISSYIFSFLNHEMSGNVIDLCPVGALTSKPYLFSARPWELNSLESIDILDSMCSSVRLDYLNNKLMRILPVYNKTVNEDWITNKARFVYDSNLYQRLIYPLMKTEVGLINITWLKALNLFYSNLRAYGLKSSVVAFCGNLVDANTIDDMNSFFNSLGMQVSMESSFSFIDMQFNSDVVLPSLFAFENQRKIIMVGLNLRVELPLLNSRLRRLDNVALYSIGLNNSYNNLAVKTIGFTVSDVINIVKGMSPFNIFKQSYIFSSFNKKIHSICFLFGAAFYNAEASSSLYSYVKNWVFSNFIGSYCFNLFNNVGQINYLLSMSAGKRNVVINPLTASFVFLEGVDNFLFLRQLAVYANNYIVYHGSFFDEGAKQADLILPNATYFESSLKFFSYTGQQRQTNKIVDPVSTVLSAKDFYYYLSFFNKVFNNNFTCIPNFTRVLSFFSFLKPIFHGIPFGVVFQYNFHFATNFLISNKILGSSVFNYYKSDVYSRNSKNLHLASLEYMKLLNIYIK